MCMTCALRALNAKVSTGPSALDETLGVNDNRAVGEQFIFRATRLDEDVQTANGSGSAPSPWRTGFQDSFPDFEPERSTYWDSTPPIAYASNDFGIGSWADVSFGNGQGTLFSF